MYTHVCYRTKLNSGENFSLIFPFSPFLSFSAQGNMMYHATRSYHLNELPTCSVSPLLFYINPPEWS